MPHYHSKQRASTPNDATPTLQQRAPTPQTGAVPATRYPTPLPQLHPPTTYPYPNTPKRVYTTRDQYSPRTVHPPHYATGNLPHHYYPTRGATPYQSKYHDPPTQQTRVFTTTTDILPQRHPTRATSANYTTEILPTHKTTTPTPPLPHEKRDGPLPSRKSTRTRETSTPHATPPDHQRDQYPPLPTTTPPNTTLPILPETGTTGATHPGVGRPSTLSWGVPHFPTKDFILFPTLSTCAMAQNDNTF